MGINFQERVMFYTDSEFWIHKWLTNRLPCPWQGVWTRWYLKVPSDPNPSVILCSILCPHGSLRDFSPFSQKEILAQVISATCQRKAVLKPVAELKVTCSVSSFVTGLATHVIDFKNPFSLWKTKLAAWTSSIRINPGHSLQPGNTFYYFSPSRFEWQCKELLHQSCFLSPWQCRTCHVWVYIDQILMRWSFEPAASSLSLGFLWLEKDTQCTVAVW